MQTKKSKQKIRLLKLADNFVNKIVNDENIINKELLQKYFGYIISESIIFGNIFT